MRILRSVRNVLPILLLSFASATAFGITTPGVPGLYAVDASDNSLWWIDPQSGTSTQVGGTPNSVGAWSGLAFHEGQLYSTEVNSVNLGVVNPASGEITPVLPQSFNNWQAAVSIDGEILAWEYGGNNSGGFMHSIDPDTGIETERGFMSGTMPRGADLDESNDTLYAIGSDNALYTLVLDPSGTGGTATTIGPTGVVFGASRVGLAYNPVDQQLYALGDDAGDGDVLYRIDKTTGAATFVMKTPIGTGTSLEYLVPEPASLGLLAVAAPLLMRRC